MGRRKMNCRGGLNGETGFWDVKSVAGTIANLVMQYENHRNRN